MGSNFTNLSIRVSHINVRQSLSLLLVRLIIVEILFSIFILTAFFPLTVIDNLFNRWSEIFNIHTAVFILVVVFKLLLMILIMVQWMNEYFELQPTQIIHRKGLFFKKNEKYIFLHIMSVDLHQSLFGKLLNYGTIHMYDRFIYKDIYLHYVQNPQRYFNILKNLIPTVDSEEEKVTGTLRLQED